MIVLTGQPYRELYPVVAASLGCYVLGILLDCKNLVQEIPQLNFTPGSACLDVRQNLFEVADAGCQVLHLTQPFMHKLQLSLNELKGFPQPCF